MWFLIAKLQNFDENTWVYQMDLIEATYSRQYLTACNWALQTLTTVGYGDTTITTTLEQGITITWMFFGVAFYSFTIGNLAALISSVDSKAAHLQQKLNMLSEFSKRKRLPDNLEARIKKFIENNH
jgi:hypothetical protein